MYHLKTTPPEEASDDLKETYDTLQEMFGTVPKVFVAMSLRTDILRHMVLYVKHLLIETHGLPRVTKELIAAYVSKINSCEY
jgi:alkylhydroperoxidase family enzyme